MDTGESMQLIKQGCAQWTGLLMSLNKQCNQQLTLLAFGWTIVASAYQLLKIHLMLVGIFYELRSNQVAWSRDSGVCID